MARTTVTKVHRCPACNAPLELPAGATRVDCGYCNAHVNIERKAKPKNVQIPPPQRGGEVVLYTEAARAAGNRAAGIIVFMALLGVIIPGVLGFVIFRSAAETAGGAFGGAGGGTAVSLPGSCAVNQKVVIEGENLEIDGVALKADANCQIEIRNSTITADKVVEATSANVKIKVINSTLVGRKVALDLGTSNPEVTIDAKSSVSGKVGLSAGHNLKLTIEGGTLAGEKAAVDCKGNAVVKMEGGTIKSDGDGLDLNHNGKLHLSDGASIEAKEAVLGGSGIELHLDGAKVVGTKVAVDVDAVTVEASGEGALIQGPVAIETGHMATLDLSEGARIVATDTAVKSGHAIKIELDGGKIESEGDGLDAKHTITLDLSGKSLIKATKTAVQSTYNVEIELEDSRIEGGKRAIKARSKEKLEMDDASAIEGEQKYDR